MNIVQFDKNDEIMDEALIDLIDKKLLEAESDEDHGVPFLSLSEAKSKLENARKDRCIA